MIGSNVVHVPVLYRETIDSLRLGEWNGPRVVFDGTLGLGGHAGGIIGLLGPSDTYIGTEWDADNLAVARERIELVLANKNLSDRPTVRLLHGSYVPVHDILAGLGIERVTHALYDLGISSPHVEDSRRGFSFRSDGPLDMRFDRSPSGGPTAGEWLDGVGIDELARVLGAYGEEPNPYRVARRILEARPIRTTAALLEAIERSSRDRKSPTRIFQAIRIAVNGELDNVRTGLENILGAMAPDGIVSVITFHSIEDRLVKRLFAEVTADTIDDRTGRTAVPAQYAKLTRKPVEPSAAEIETNPRSRSAKLRSIRKNDLR